MSNEDSPVSILECNEDEITLARIHDELPDTPVLNEDEEHVSIHESEEDDWSYSDEEYELVHDGIDADQTETDADREKVSLYMRPDLFGPNGEPINVQTRLNEEYIIMNEDIIPYDSKEVPFPERTRMLHMTGNSAWAVECNEKAFENGDDAPATSKELREINTYKIDLLWTRLRSTTLRIQIDEMVSMLLSRITIDPDNRQAYREMIRVANDLRADMPPKTQDEQSRHPRALQNARSLMGIPKERVEHPRIGMSRMTVVTRDAYDIACKTSTYKHIQDRIREVIDLKAAASRHYARNVKAGVPRKKLARIHSKVKRHTDRCQELETQFKRMTLDPLARLPMRGQDFPDARDSSHEAGAVFEYEDVDAISARGGKGAPRPIYKPRPTDSRDTCERRILISQMSRKWALWKYAKSKKYGTVLANGIVKPGQFVFHDKKTNSSIREDRVMIAEQFLDDTWVNRWNQPVWTIRIRVHLTSDLIREKSKHELPVYYIRDTTHTLGHLCSIDLASPKNNREQLLLLQFDNQVVVIQPLDLQQYVQSRSTQPNVPDSAGTTSASDVSGTDDLDALLYQIDPDAATRATSGKRKKKKKKKKRGKKKYAAKPHSVEQAEQVEQVEPVEPAEQNNIAYDTFEDLVPDGVKEDDIMSGLDRDNSQIVETLQTMDKNMERDMAWAHGVVLDLQWPFDGKHIKAGHPVVTSACIDNTQSPCETIYLGSYHGVIYRVVWRASQCIDSEHFPYETPIIDLHMQQPHLVGRTVSDVLVFHGTTQIRPFQAENGFCVGAHVCGALMACITSGGSVWITDLHTSGAVRNIIPDKKLCTVEENETFKKAMEEQKKAADADADAAKGGVDTPTATDTKGGGGDIQTNDDAFVEEDFVMDANAENKEKEEDDGAPTVKMELNVPVTYSYRGVYMKRREIFIMYPSGALRKFIIKPGQENALESARNRVQKHAKRVAKEEKKKAKAAEKAAQEVEETVENTTDKEGVNE